MQKCHMWSTEIPLLGQGVLELSWIVSILMKPTILHENLISRCKSLVASLYVEKKKKKKSAKKKLAQSKGILTGFFDISNVEKSNDQVRKTEISKNFVIDWTYSIAS